MSQAVTSGKRQLPHKFVLDMVHEDVAAVAARCSAAVKIDGESMMITFFEESSRSCVLHVNAFSVRTCEKFSLCIAEAEWMAISAFGPLAGLDSASKTDLCRFLMGQLARRNGVLGLSGSAAAEASVPLRRTVVKLSGYKLIVSISAPSPETVRVVGYDQRACLTAETLVTADEWEKSLPSCGRSISKMDQVGVGIRVRQLTPVTHACARRARGRRCATRSCKA